MNTTVNGSSCSIPLNPTAEKIGKTIAYSLIFVVSVVENSLIGIIVYKTRRLRKPINFFIVNMAMSDLLVAIFLFPFELIGLYVNSWLISGPLGQAFCKLVPFLGFLSMLVSIQSLVLIAVDRFGAVVFPFRSPLISSKLCPFFILATWIVAMAFMSPYLFAFKLVEYPERQACEKRWNEAFGESLSEAHYFLASHVVFFHISVALLTILYSIILVKVKSQKTPGEQSVNADEQRAKKNRNMLKMAIAIVLAFMLCWLPISIIKLLYFFAWDSRWPCDAYLYFVTAWFVARSNCAINPCICFIFSTNYRQGLKKLLKCFGAS